MAVVVMAVEVLVLDIRKRTHLYNGKPNRGCLRRTVRSKPGMVQRKSSICLADKMEVSEPNQQAKRP